jgi:hypothetical protein
MQPVPHDQRRQLGELLADRSGRCTDQRDELRRDATGGAPRRVLRLGGYK